MFIKSFPKHITFNQLKKYWDLLKKNLVVRSSMAIDPTIEFFLFIIQKNSIDAHIILGNAQKLQSQQLATKIF
jgi:hypothetical protein